MKNIAKTLLLVGVLALASFGIMGSAFAASEVGPDCPGSGQDCAYDDKYTYVKGFDNLR